MHPLQLGSFPCPCVDTACPDRALSWQAQRGEPFGLSPAASLRCGPVRCLGLAASSARSAPFLLSRTGWPPARASTRSSLRLVQSYNGPDTAPVPPAHRLLAPATRWLRSCTMGRVGTHTVTSFLARNVPRDAPTLRTHRTRPRIPRPTSPRCYKAGPADLDPRPRCALGPGGRGGSPILGPRATSVRDGCVGCVIVCGA